MADRTVSVKLRADVSSYVASLKTAAGQTKTFASGLETGITKNKAQADAVALGLLGIGLAAGVVALKAVKSFADFDAAMSDVQASTHETAGNMDLLRNAAMDAGARTAFSAIQAAGAVSELAKAGVSTADILGGALDGALALAAAGSLDVGDAAETAATAMTQFKLSGKDVPHIADLLAAAAGKAQGDVSDMAMALKQSGLVAAQFGFSVDETVGVLAEFASAGLIGSDAGTSLRTMLLRLANPSKQAADELKALGINVYDAGGNMVKPAVLAGELSSQMSKLDPATRNAALATIFGSDAIRAASVLYADGSAKAAGWVSSVNDTGYAAETAAIKQNNLKGDLEKLSGAFDTLMIEMGSGANGPLRDVVQALTGVVDMLGGIPAPVRAAALGVAGFTAILALTGAGGIKAVQGYTAAKAAITTLGISGKTAGFALGGLGIVFTLATFVVGAYAKSHAEAKARVEDFTAAIKADSGALGDNTRQAVVNALQKKGALDDAKALGISLVTVTDAMLGNAAAQKTVNDVLGKYLNESPAQLAAHSAEGSVVDENANAAGRLAAATGSTNGELQKAIKSSQQNTEAMGGSTDATKLSAAALDAARLKAAGLFPVLDTTTAAFSYLTAAQQANEAALSATKTAVDALVTSMHILDGDAIGTTEATIGFKNAVFDLKSNLDGSTRSLSINTEGGRKNQTALIGLIKDANTHAEAVTRQTASIGKGTAVLETDIAAIRKAATAAGLNKAAVDKLIGSYVRIPAKKATTITAPGLSKQLTDSKAYKQWLDSLPAAKRTLVTAPGLYTELGHSKSFNDYLRAQPKATQSRVSAPGLSGELSRIQAFNRYLDTVNGKTAVSTTIWRKITQNIITHSQAPTPMNHATGGPVLGAGTATSDDILMYGSNGEHMLTASDVEKAGGQAAIYRLRAGIQAGVLRFAGGGQVDLSVDAGRVRGYARGGVASAAPTDWGRPQVVAPQPSGLGQLTGRLYLDNGTFLGIVKGEVRHEVSRSAMGANRKRG